MIKQRFPKKGELFELLESEIGFFTLSDGPNWEISKGTILMFLRYERDTSSVMNGRYYRYYWFLWEEKIINILVSTHKEGSEKEEFYRTFKKVA